MSVANRRPRLATVAFNSPKYTPEFFKKMFNREISVNCYPCVAGLTFRGLTFSDFQYGDITMTDLVTDQLMCSLSMMLKCALVA